MDMDELALLLKQPPVAWHDRRIKLRREKSAWAAAEETYKRAMEHGLPHESAATAAHETFTSKYVPSGADGGEDSGDDSDGSSDSVDSMPTVRTQVCTYCGRTAENCMAVCDARIKAGKCSTCKGWYKDCYCNGRTDDDPRYDDSSVDGDSIDGEGWCLYCEKHEDDCRGVCDSRIRRGACSKCSTCGGDLRDPSPDGYAVTCSCGKDSNSDEYAAPPAPPLHEHGRPAAPTTPTHTHKPHVSRGHRLRYDTRTRTHTYAHH